MFEIYPKCGRLCQYLYATRPAGSDGVDLGAKIIPEFS